MNSVTGLIIVFFSYAFLFSIAEILYTKGVSAKITRKVVHIGGGVVSFFLPWLVNFETVIIIGIVFSLFLIWSQKRRILNSVHGTKKDSFGAALFPLGLLFCAIIFWNINPVIFQGSVLLVGLSDGIAGLIGEKFGKRKYCLISPKTLEGSLSFFVISFFILFIIIFIQTGFVELSKISFLLLSALLLTFIEGLFGRGWDNFFVPIFGGLVIYLLL